MKINTQLTSLVFIAVLMQPINSNGEDGATSQSQNKSTITLKQDEELKALTNAISSVASITDSIAKKKSIDCLSAFGNKSFCSCLADQLPIGIDFPAYIKIVTTPKNELGYFTMSQDAKDMVENAIKARNICAAKGRRK